MSQKSSRYQAIAERLQQEAEAGATVHVYISADDVAEALGDRDFDEDDPYKALREWIIERRRLGFDPTSEDILDWTAGIAAVAA